MFLPDLFYYGLVEADTEGYEYALKFVCRVDDKLILPDRIKKRFSDVIVLSFQSNLNHSMDYDYNKKELHLNLSFSGVSCRATIPHSNVIQILDERTGDRFLLQSIVSPSQAITTGDQKPIEKKKEDQKSKLTVIDCNPNAEEMADEEKEEARKRLTLIKK